MDTFKKAPCFLYSTQLLSGNLTDGSTLLAFGRVVNASTVGPVTTRPGNC